MIALADPVTANLPVFCPLHSHYKRLGVDEGRIIFACGCSLSQKTGALTVKLNVEPASPSSSARQQSR